MTPAAAREPYMEDDAASFKTDMLSTSFGFTSLILPGTPSIITNGLVSPIVVIPRTRILPAAAPGALLSRVTVTPAIAPCNAVDNCVVLRAAKSSPFIAATEPVRSFFFMVP